MVHLWFSASKDLMMMEGGLCAPSEHPLVMGLDIHLQCTVFHTRRVQWPLFHILSHISKTLQVVDTSHISKNLQGLLFNLIMIICCHVTVSCCGRASKIGGLEKTLGSKFP